MTTEQSPLLSSYDTIIVAFSGGKDSLACVLALLDAGVDKSRIELWHHDVDGREGSSLMDWPCTRDYCRRVAEHLGLPLFFSWKVGGFEREMWRKNQPTAPTKFELPNKMIGTAGGHGQPGTRERFPQVSADLKVRWCSAYLKIDVSAIALRNQERFNGKRTLLISGERAEESPARSKYKVFEPDRSDNRNGKARRHVDRWRPVHKWSEERVWRTIQKHGIVPHPAYRLGWGRVSCAACIFGSPDQWASLRAVNPRQFAAVAAAEAKTGKTIQRKLSVTALADKGKPYLFSEADAGAALSELHVGPIAVPVDEWVMPLGAFGDSCGPT